MTCAHERDWQVAKDRELTKAVLDFIKASAYSPGDS